MARILVHLCVATAAGILGGCQPPSATRGGFNSPNPASKLYAIHRAGVERDTGTIGHLVEQLDSDDPAVRMMAIMALERMVGTRLGYNPYTTVVKRRAAIEQWTQAVRNGSLGLGGPRDSSTID